MTIRIYQEETLIYQKDLVENQVKELKGFMRLLCEERIPMEDIEIRVCTYYGLEPEQLRTKIKTREITDAKRMIWYRLVYVNKWTHTEAAKEYNRTHSAVTMGIKAMHEIPGLMEKYKKIFNEDRTNFGESA